jgi:hypothetical protein
MHYGRWGSKQETQPTLDRWSNQRTEVDFEIDIGEENERSGRCVVFDVAVAVAVAVDVNSALGRCQMWRLSVGNCEETCLSEASWSLHPTGNRHSWGPDRREGNGFAVAFSLLTFFWLSKRK